MARNRIIYQSEAIYVSQNVKSTGSKGHEQLHRVQSANYSFNVARQDVNQFGQLSRIDSIILEAPTASVDLTYLLADGFNEEALNFAKSANLNSPTLGFISGQIEATTGVNFYILTAPEGEDINTKSTQTSNLTSIGIGNAFLTDYTLDAAVGDFPTVTCTFEASNMNSTSTVAFHTGIHGAATIGQQSGQTGFTGVSGVGIDPEAGTVLSDFAAGGEAGTQVAQFGVVLPTGSDGNTNVMPTALRPSDIILSLSNADGKSIADIDGTDAAHIQSLSLSIPMSRTAIERIGTRFPFARVVDFPIVPTLSVSAVLNEAQTRAVSDVIDSDTFISNADILFRDQSSVFSAGYRLTNLKLDSEAFTSSIGPNKTVDLTFSLSIGGPEDTSNNIFFSGKNAITPFGRAEFAKDVDHLNPAS